MLIWLSEEIIIIKTLKYTPLKTFFSVRKRPSREQTHLFIRDLSFLLECSPRRSTTVFLDHNKCLAVIEEWLNIVYFVHLFFSCDQSVNKYIHLFLLLMADKLQKDARNYIEYHWWRHYFTRRFMRRCIRGERLGCQNR